MSDHIYHAVEQYRIACVRLLHVVWLVTSRSFGYAILRRQHSLVKGIAALSCEQSAFLLYYQVDNPLSNKGQHP